MKILKRIGLGLLAIIAILLIVALFLPKEMHVRREVTIARPRAEVFNYIRYIKNQDNYSKWNMEDPNMKKSYRGTDGTPGFVYSWESDKMGVGEQEIEKITDGERMNMQLRFVKPFKSVAAAYMTTTDAGAGQTRVEWAFEGHHNWPMNLMGALMSGRVGDDLQTGLNNLKKNLESTQPISQTVH
jgi:uncharacterized protein YndB with AHSA1/START domain